MEPNGLSEAAGSLPPTARRPVSDPSDMRLRHAFGLKRDQLPPKGKMEIVRATNATF